MKDIIASHIAIPLCIIGCLILSTCKTEVKNENGQKKIVQSIAVLPFENMSNEPGQEYFSDGLADGILNSLAHLKDLKVCARTSSFKFRDQNINIKEIGKQLGVRTVLEGRCSAKRRSCQDHCSIDQCGRRISFLVRNI